MVNAHFINHVAVPYDNKIISYDIDILQSFAQFVHFLLENFGTDAKRHAFVSIPAKRCMEGRQKLRAIVEAHLLKPMTDIKDSEQLGSVQPCRDVFNRW